MPTMPLGQRQTQTKILSEEVQGIDWNTKNNDGKSLMEIATEMNKKAISKFLERRLKKRAEEAELEFSYRADREYGAGEEIRRS